MIRPVNQKGWQMNDDAQNIGNLFKQKRKETNLSLKEAENATSIRMVYLQAIEDGEMSKLISPVYAQGFIRQYATFLGIDGDRIVRENPEHFNREPTPEFSYGIGTLETRGNPGSGAKWFPNALWIVAFGLVLAIAWYFARFLDVV